MSDALSTTEAAELQANQPLPSGNGHDPSPNGHAAETAIELAAKTLAGDLRDGVWRVLQDYGLLLKRTEVEQRRVAEAIAVETARLVSEAVALIAGRDFPTIPVGLEQITFKPKGVETKMVMSALDRQRRHELVDSQGKIVLLVVADPSAFMGSRGAAKIDALAAEDEKPAVEPELPLAERIAELAEEGRQLAEDMRETPPGQAPPNLAARADGWEDGREGVRDHAARWKSGTPGHGDYAIGHAKGQEERAAAGHPIEPEPEEPSSEAQPVVRRPGRKAVAEASP